MCENCPYKNQIEQLETRLSKVEERILFAPAMAEGSVYGASGWDRK